MRLALQHEDATDGVAGRQHVNQPPAADSGQQPGKQHPAAESNDRHRKVLRTYGQKKAKPDAAADNAATTLSSDFLALVGGKQ